MRNEGLIRCQLKDGRSVLIPFSRYIRMSDEEYHNFDTGYTGNYTTLPGDIVDFDRVNTIDDELDPDVFDQDIVMDLDLDREMLDEDDPF